MCLDRLTTNKALTAKKNIKVWKAGDPLIRNWMVVGITTPYRGSIQLFGKLLTSKMATRDLCIVHQGLHSMRFKGGALRISKNVYRAIIPKGARYWLGSFDGRSGYASNKLIILKPKKRK